MSEVARFLTLLQLVILLIIIILAWIYALPIIFIRRFHTVTNILTCNVCFVSFLGSLYWTIDYTLDGFYFTGLKQRVILCTTTPYFQTMINCLVIYAFLMITINRFFLVIYPNKRLFKRVAWPFISFVIQWLIAVILPLPYFTSSSENCVRSQTIPLWMRVYGLSVMVILPSILNGILNLFIFLKVKLSTQRLSMGAMSQSVTKSSRKSLSSRDVSLLKHMLFLHVVFVIGWAPIFLLPIIEMYVKIPFLVDLSFQLLPALSLLIGILDLFLYNRELRRYFYERFCESFSSKSNK